MAADTVSFRPHPNLRDRLEEYAAAEDVSEGKALEQLAEIGLQQEGYDATGDWQDATLEDYAYEAAKVCFGVATFLLAFHIFLPGSFLLHTGYMGALGGVALAIERVEPRVSNALGLATDAEAA